MTTYLRLELPYYLLQSYADLSMAQVRYSHRYGSAPYPGHTHNFALLSLNAAIVEGTLRSFLHWYLFEQQEISKKNGMKNGQLEYSLPERALIKLRLEIDTHDTWSKLKDKFKFVFGTTLADQVTPPILGEIEHLFTIRNRSAHGSSIQLPKEVLNDTEDEYLFSLQQKLSKLNQYLVNTTGATDIWGALGSLQLSAKMWSVTQQFVTNLDGVYSYPSELAKSLNAIKKYSFGKVMLE